MTHTLARIARGAGNNLYEVVVPSSFVFSSVGLSASAACSPSPIHPPTPTTAPAASSSSSSSGGGGGGGAATLLVEMPRRFRSTIWVKRGSYVVVDVAALAGRENKLGGEIVNVVREEKRWRRMPYW